MDGLLLGGANRVELGLAKLALDWDVALDDMRLASQGGNLGADFGRGGMTLGFPETDVLEGNFTFGKPGGDGDIVGELLHCTKLRLKLCTVKAKVMVS